MGTRSAVSERPDLECNGGGSAAMLPGSEGSGTKSDRKVAELGHLGTEETSRSVPSPDFVGGPIWRCKWRACTASTQDSTEGRSWRLSSVEGAHQLRVPTGSARVAWGARGVRVGEARNPGLDDMLKPTHWRVEHQG